MNINNFFMYIHFSALTCMAIYGIYRFSVMVIWFRKGIRNKKIPVITSTDIPLITIQLPIYNESRVAGRLIDSVCKIEWPDDRLEIQVLDDSTDITRAIVDDAAAHWRKSGKDIKVLRRPCRKGYKAGALSSGMKQAKGEFFAIFDADFCPPADFLNSAMAHFRDDNTGFVQAKWGYINEETSWFTRLQALFLTGHFVIEQAFRDYYGLFFNFNGTAGIWRKEAVISSGGWQSDTVTEDLDLSFRAHLAGWKGVYLQDIVVPSELPPSISAFRNQQKRWAKGSMQTAKKLLVPLWKSRAGLGQKMDGTAHMLANLGWLCGLIIFLTLFPVLISRKGIGIYQIIRIDLPLFLCSTFAITLFFMAAEKAGRGKPLSSTLNLIWLLPAFSLGMAPAITTGVIEGLFTKGGEFIRTPKFGNSMFRTGFPVPDIKSGAPWLFINILMVCYSMLPILFAAKRGTWAAIPFLSIFAVGALMMLYLDILEAR